MTIKEGEVIEFEAEGGAEAQAEGGCSVTRAGVGEEER